MNNYYFESMDNERMKIYTTMNAEATYQVVSGYVKHHSLNGRRRKYRGRRNKSIIADTIL